MVHHGHAAPRRNLALYLQPDPGEHPGDADRRPGHEAEPRTHDGGAPTFQDHAERPDHQPLDEAGDHGKETVGDEERDAADDAQGGLHRLEGAETIMGP